MHSNVLNRLFLCTFGCFIPLMVNLHTYIFVLSSAVSSLCFSPEAEFALTVHHQKAHKAQSHHKQEIKSDEIEFESYCSYFKHLCSSCFCHCCYFSLLPLPSSLHLFFSSLWHCLFIIRGSDLLMPRGKFTLSHLHLSCGFYRKCTPCTLSREHKWIIYDASLGSAESVLM